MTPLELRLVLHRFMCREFGYGDLGAMLDRLRDVPTGGAAGGESEYALQIRPHLARSKIDWASFADYDAEIATLSRQLRMDGRHGRDWKPHQWLALLFAEHYLRRYFEDPEALCHELNETKKNERLTAAMPDYTVHDLRTVAVQSATGSGKTLVMHAHILQYRRLSGAAGRPPNNVILVTPNEQLSAQHEREFLASNLPARVFSAEAGADLLAPVEIIDLNKLAEKKGVKRIAVSDFGDNNLVLVDEGHLGASGRVWRERRAELARGGFTFEYSATFNQIVGNDAGLRDAYGKCMLFDYPYRAFHADGYGKDYAIANLPKGDEDANSRMYLLGCLLSFYRQCRIWREGHAGWVEFNVTRPLWVFLGKTVTGKTKADVATKSDVARILDFFGWVLAHGEEVGLMINRLLAGESGLTDDDGADFFAGRFDDLEGNNPDALYDDLCRVLFHGPGQLHVRYLTQGDGELHLRTADNAPFGVVNIGDSAALFGLLNQRVHLDLVIEREAGFARRLFADVDLPDSTVNVVIGARRFIAGWNSWRVSTMGLMHVGVGEGPEIIQMFGRGVRLKGWNMSLKRHRQSGAEPPSNSHRLAELETLHIFGLRAHYMQTFRELLEKDGTGVERTTVALPVTWNFARKDLKIFRLEKGLEYGHSTDRPVLGEQAGLEEPVVEMDFYSRLQTVESGNRQAVPAVHRAPVKLEPRHVVLFDRARIYREILARKRQKNWYNLAITRAEIDKLLERNDWYTLYVPPERVAVRSYADLQRLEDIVVELIAEYVAQLWQRRRARWEHEHIEVTTLKEHDENNIGMYELSVDSKEEGLIEDLQTLVSSLKERTDHKLQLGLLIRDSVAYKPLLYATGKGQVTVQPVPLDANERQVVERLGGLAEASDPSLQGRELFLIRNLTRGRGVSFFDDHAYYPDFIVWLVGEGRQHIVFLDPKGLVRFGPEERKKVRLHNEIVEIEKRVRESDPNLHLHAYILSVTPPEKIGDEARTQREWEHRGVYFLRDRDWPRRVLEDVLGSIL